MMILKLFRVSLICLLALGLGSASVSSQRKKQIAVLNFDFATVDIGLARNAYGNQENLARAISDKLMNNLRAQGTSVVIERSQLEKVLHEQNLGIQGRIDPSTAAKVGSILGIDALIIGTVSVFDLQGLPKDSRDTAWTSNNLRARITVNYRVVNTTTAVIEASNEAIGTSTGDGLGDSKLGRIMRKAGSASEPAKVKDEDIRNIVQRAVDDVVNQITVGVEGYLSGSSRQPLPLASVTGKQINGQVVSTNGSEVFITGINKSAVRIGDRLFVQRSHVIPGPGTGKQIRFSDKIGEVEITEIQGEVIVGSFSGSGKAKEGDIITNSPSTPPPPAKTGPTFPSLTTANPPTLTPRSSKSTPEPVERYPVIDCPDTVTEAKEFAVQVFLLLEPQRALAVVKQGTPTPSGGIALPLPQQPEQQPWKIEVVLSVPDFEFTGGPNTNIGTILLHPVKNSPPAIFRLKPKKVSQTSETAEISATLWHAGDFLGQISRTLKITRMSQTSQTSPIPNGPALPTTVNEVIDIVQEIGRQKLPASSSPQAEDGKTPLAKQQDAPLQDASATIGSSFPAATQTISPKLAIDPNRKSPDLTILIRERIGNHASAKAEIVIHAPPYLATTSSTFDIGPDVARWLEAQYETFAQHSGRDLKRVEAGTNYPLSSHTDAMLQGFGRDLYKKLAPPVFRDAFWQLTKILGDKFTSIQIISDNPTIPWELMRPVRADGTGERDFLGVEFNIGRSHLAEGVTLMEKPPQSLAINKLSVIAPQYKGKAQLPYQSKEVRMLEQVRGYRSVGGRFSEVKKLFAGTPEGIVHFAGHAGVLLSHSTVKNFALQLEDVPLDVQTWQGLLRQKLIAHPFFFFNACQIGQTQRVANFVNGWAPAVLDAGASGYVGTLWPINDRGAYEFAAKFYEILGAELKRGPISVAEILRQTRATFLKNGDPTFLAYVYYGDPNLTFYAQRR